VPTQLKRIRRGCWSTVTDYTPPESAKETVYDRLIEIVRPAFVQFAVFDRINKYSIELSALTSSLEYLSSDHDCSIRSGHEIDDRQQTPLCSAIHFRERGKCRDLTDMISGERIVTAVMKSKVVVIALAQRAEITCAPSLTVAPNGLKIPSAPGVFVELHRWLPSFDCRAVLTQDGTDPCCRQAPEETSTRGRYWAFHGGILL
jgi:hypothetical protein